VQEDDERGEERRTEEHSRKQGRPKLLMTNPSIA
jgi:hypothetical protein